MLFFYHIILKTGFYIVVLAFAFLLLQCTGSRKYFKAAERMEKMGLVNDAAEFYFQSLQRKPTNVDARVKLKEVGQKYSSSMASEFFRNLNTGQTEATLETYERMKDFNDRCKGLNVMLDYPQTYDDDYKKTVEVYCAKNYQQASLLVNQKKYNEAQPYLGKINRYNKNYKNTAQLSVVATCEPLYQTAITNLENKNYAPAISALSAISLKSDNYKDSRELLQMATAQNSKQFILFEPSGPGSTLEKNIEAALFNNMNQVAADRLGSVKVINNTPFQQTPGSFDFNKSANVDLIQAIRKATGADYFYFFDVSNAKEYDSGPSTVKKVGYQEYRTKKNDSVTVVEYKPFNYNQVKASRTLSYQFNYRLVNAQSSQIVSSQSKTIQSNDAIEYQEFIQNYRGSVNSLFPYNPQETAPIAQYNAKAWRNAFSARNTLKTFEELKNDVYGQNLNLFISSASYMK